MVIVAAAIITRSGAIVISRQFVPIGRSRVETLLAQFPRLLQSGQQHTFVETDEVRYVYQPLEAHYLVMVTSKGSNILQDMNTLRLLSRVVGEHGHGSEGIKENSVDIMLAFDEVITLGYRENITHNQLNTILAMESQEEIIQEIIAKNKMQEAKEAAKRKIKQIEMEKKEAARRQAGVKGSGGYPGQNGYGSLSPSSSSGMRGSETLSFAAPIVHQQPSNTPVVTATVRSGKGMKLGKKITDPL